MFYSECFILTAFKFALEYAIKQAEETQME